MDEQTQQGEFITHLLNGNNALIKEDYDSAVREYGSALRLNPKFFLAAAKLGDSYLKKGEYRSAVKYLLHALELNPEQPRVMFKLGQAYEALGMHVQASVAFEMAKEKGAEREYMTKVSSTTGTRRRRAQRSTSGRSLSSVNVIDIVGGAVSTVFSHPTIILPFLLSAVLLSAGEVGLDNMFLRLSGKVASDISIAQVILTGHFKYNPNVMLHYMVLGVYIALMCAPLLSVAPVMVNDAYRGRRVSFRKAMKRAFKQISPITGFAMIFFSILACANVLSAVIVVSINRMLTEMAGLKISFFWVSSLAIPFSASYFIYTVHSIVIEKRSMEKGFEKGMRVGKRFVGLSFMILLAYTAIHLLLAFYIFNNYQTVGFIKTRYIVLLAVTPFQAFTGTALTLIFLRSQQVKRKKRDSSLPKMSADNLNEEIMEDAAMD